MAVPSRLQTLAAPLRLLLMLAIVVVLWLPLGIPILLWVKDPNGQSILGLGYAYGLLVFVMRLWGQRVAGRSAPLAYYGLQWGTFGQPWIQGFALGTAVVLSLYGVQSLFGWVTWQAPSGHFVRIAAEGLAVSAGVGFAEELLFRGWMLTELETDYGPRRAALISSALFALLHFIKPWSEILRTFPQFPGLFLLALILVKAKRRHLGYGMGIHGGLVWGYYLIQVGSLIIFNDRIPLWLTGVNHNPLAGLLGLAALGVWLKLYHRS